LPQPASRSRRRALALLLGAALLAPLAATAGPTERAGSAVGAGHLPESVAAVGADGPAVAIAPGSRAATARRPAPASQPLAAPVLEPSAQYRSSLAHQDVGREFAAGARVTTPFVPRPDDDWDVDGAPPQALPAGAATGAYEGQLVVTTTQNPTGRVIVPVAVNARGDSLHTTFGGANGLFQIKTRAAGLRPLDATIAR